MLMFHSYVNVYQAGSVLMLGAISMGHPQNGAIAGAGFMETSWNGHILTGWWLSQPL